MSSFDSRNKQEWVDKNKIVIKYNALIEKMFKVQSRKNLRKKLVNNKKYFTVSSKIIIEFNI